MHILVMPSWYSNSLQPNSGIFFRHHAECLKELGHTVGVAFYEGRVLRSLSPRALTENRFQVCEGFEHHLQTVRIKGWNPLSQSSTGAQVVGRLFERAALAYMRTHGKPDVVHVQSGMWAGLGALRLKEQFAIPYVLTEHSNFVPSSHESLAKNRLYQNIARQATFVTAVSRAMAEDLRHKYDLDDILVTPNCIDYDFWKSAGEPQSQNSPKFITVAHLVELKQIDVLLTAFEIVRKSRPDASLSIIGAGVDRVKLEQLASSLGAGSAIAFLGELSHQEIRSEFLKSACYVCSSRVETFGVALLEAMASGLSVVSTACGGPDDFVSAPSGLLVPVNNPAEMAHGMLTQINGDRSAQIAHSRIVAAKYGHREVGLELESVLMAAIAKTTHSDA
jgi:glycosyltransferase involved in cell wall biosynthesis